MRIVFIGPLSKGDYVLLDTQRRAWYRLLTASIVLFCICIVWIIASAEGLNPAFAYGDIFKTKTSLPIEHEISFLVYDLSVYAYREIPANYERPLGFNVSNYLKTAYERQSTSKKKNTEIKSFHVWQPFVPLAPANGIIDRIVLIAWGLFVTYLIFLSLALFVISHEFSINIVGLIGLFVSFVLAVQCSSSFF